MDTKDGNGFDKYKIYLVETLKSLSKGITDLREDIDDLRQAINELKLQQLEQKGNIKVVHLCAMALPGVAAAVYLLFKALAS